TTRAQARWPPPQERAEWQNRRAWRGRLDRVAAKACLSAWHNKNRGQSNEGDDASGESESENVAHVMSRDAASRLDFGEDRCLIVVLCLRRHAPRLRSRPQVR